MQLSKKHAVICGGAGGLGQATAKKFLSQGFTTVLLDVSSSVETLAREMHADRCVGIATDLSSWESTKTAFEQIKSKAPSLDVLVNTQGWDRPTPFIETGPADWDKLIGINLKSVIHSTRSFIDQVGPAGGWIVNVSSDAGRIGTKGEGVYSACKAGLIGFSKTMARELAKANILVNCVAPGPIDTPLFASIVSERPKLIEKMVAQIPLGRIGKPEEVAEVIYFLASPQNSFVTGQIISASGGLTMVG
jgi:2-hydroxycyclohexanecarboxyl-CoA dehydrogenase